jgi:antitoxin CptB
MRELDTLLTRFLEHEYAASDEPQKAAFRKLLSLPDPELTSYLLGKSAPADGELQRIVERVLLRVSS